MKHPFVTVMAFAAGTLGMPAQRDTSPIYSTDNPVIKSTCPVPSSAQPLGGLYPVANFLGSAIKPVLDGIIGKQTVEDLDKVADQLCVSAQQDPTAGDGICQDTFGAVHDFVDAETPLSQSKQYGCLLNLLCIDHAGPENAGTCNQLLAGADCVANRIVGVSNQECK